MTTQHTIQSVAKDTQQYFERITRGEDTITVLTDARPEWLFDAVYSAHGEMLPDDWKFAVCESAVDALAESDDADLDDLAHEFADGEIDVYNGARLQWLSSNLNRVYYVEDAAKEYGTENNAGEFDLFQLIGQGQYAEARECFDTIRNAIEAEAERLNSEEE